ncbi:MAG: BrnT family toxin [Deltaproteobacteria bacterium]|nr:BrnT family toxin [Deltaproteobacteria bacterium]
MKLVDDPETAEWLGQFTGRAEDFDWDKGNQTKNRKHGVEHADIEALFRFSLVFIGRILEPTHPELRWLALEQDAESRRLALVFTRRGDKLRPISCRPMRRQERRIYEDALKEDSAKEE